MLRITPERRNDETVSLKLEGRIVGPWVAELASSAAAVRATGRKLSLDMTAVSFLAPEAIGLVALLQREGVTVTGCSRFVRRQIEGAEDGDAPTA